VEVVNLDTSVPFTAARARNEGIERLIERWSETKCVHVLDGDCEFQDGWIQLAYDFMKNNESAAVVCGRRRERHPEYSMYNRLCDLEWDTPIGEARSCGGDALIQIDVFKEVGGYNPIVIAGEEPELCVRIRGKGYSIHRLDHEMTLHDASMFRFDQFWNRAKRAGHAFAQGADMHGAPPEKHCVKQVRSAVVWGFILPILALVFAWWTAGVSVLIYLGLVCAQGWKISRGHLRRGRTKSQAQLQAIFTLIAKFPQVCGVLLYWTRKILKRESKLIEYKSATESKTEMIAVKDAANAD
jgi:hypothetical protein